ncbi:MAG TPA: 6-hydroxymethylpterin diphosphokinase MptE-like protein, partial [Syntrophorhabdales bacterium]|nr:6-hydroxymethylpterin diphosphokinase MptE-like protein [Syntrophorhabdales bacterium]
HHHHLVNGKIYLVKHLPSVRLDEKAYGRFQKRLEEQKLLTLSNVGTAVGLGKNFADAFMQNVPNILRKPGVTALKDMFKGRPAVVVGAGPSLEKNLHLLRKVKSRAVVIAVDAALPTLLPAGILPDLLVAIDPLPENVALFKDNPLLKHVPFVCLAQYTPEIVDTYPGPLFINMAEQNLVALWLRPFWEEKGSILCFGGSVAHLGFAAAEYLGCSAVALIGLDLSFDEKFHAGEASSLLTEMHGVPFEFKDRADRATDIFGETRYTLSSFLTFKISFENRFKTFTGVVVNATEGGLPLEGATNLRLADFIDEYCNVPELDARTRLIQLAETEVAYNLQGLVDEVTRARDKLQEIRKYARQMLRYIERVQGLRKKGDGESQEFHGILDKIEHLTAKVRHPVLNLLTSYHYQLELYLKRQAVIEIDEMEDKLEKLDAQLDRGLNYYGELLEALGLFVNSLERLIRDLNREQKVNRILRDTRMPEEERFYAAGLALKNAGRVTSALKYLEALRRKADQKASSGGKRVSGAKSVNPADVNLSLAQLYMLQYRYGEAYELLDELSAQGKQEPCADKGPAHKLTSLLKTCREKTLAWEARKTRMTGLLKKAEETYGGSLESGLFYFRVGNHECAANHYHRAVEELSGSQSSQLPAALYGLAHTYLRLKENQKAVDAFADLLQIDPKNPVVYRDLGLVAVENGNAESGEMFLTKALELAPWSDELYRLLANLYLKLGDSKKATTLYEYGVQVNPQNTTLKKELALLYEKIIFQKGTFKM